MHVSLLTIPKTHKMILMINKNRITEEATTTTTTTTTTTATATTTTTTTTTTSTSTTTTKQEKKESVTFELFSLKYLVSYRTLLRTMILSWTVLSSCRFSWTLPKVWSTFTGAIFTPMAISKAPTVW